MNDQQSQEVHTPQPQGDSLPPEAHITPLSTDDMLALLEQPHA